MKSKIKIASFQFLIIFSTLNGSAQQSPVYSQYMFNGLAINPAYAGSHESFSMTALYRKQWVGFEGAPTTQTFAAHTPISNKKISLGLQLMNDYIGVTHQYSIDGMYAYRISIGNKGKLSMGLLTGIGRFVSNYSNLETRDPNDPSFSTDQATVLKLNFGTGIYYHSEKFYAGISAPHLVNSKINNGSSVTAAKQSSTYFATAGYVFKLSPDLKLKPSTLIKLTNASQAQMDLNCNLLIKEVIWIGVSYRSFSALVFISQIQLTEQMTLGYSYDNSLTKFQSVTKGSHEIVLTYNFKFLGSKIVSPRYF